MTVKLGELLEEIIGLNPHVLGDRTLDRAVRIRMFACKLTDTDEYFDRVRFSPEEIEALIETVVVPETQFFRDKAPFTALSRYIRDEWIPMRHAGVLRVLSAPCSSGEEPYSIAIALQEAGLSPDKYIIDAVDISRMLLEKAERAIYSQHSFRSVAAAFRRQYFTPLGQDFALNDPIKDGVQFIHGNLMDEHILRGKRPYHVVFCRNLLIYLGAAARRRVTQTIERLLSDNGLLFVGHAETQCFPAARFTPLDNRGSFGFRKKKIEIEAIAAAVTKTASRRKAVAASPIRPASPKPKEKKHPSAAAGTSHRSKESLHAARQLADQGRLTEAADLCEQLLQNNRVDADAHCLLGIVQHSMGNLREAEECFNRAIFLDESCYDAIMHLSLIKEHRGDVKGAEVLRRRAARIQPQTRIL